MEGRGGGRERGEGEEEENTDEEMRMKGGQIKKGQRFREKEERSENISSLCEH